MAARASEAADVDVSQVSRQLSWVLRRGARQSGIRIDKEGWVQVADLLKCKYFEALAEEKILHVVSASNRQKVRYELRRSTWGAGKDVRATWRDEDPPPTSRGDADKAGARATRKAGLSLPADAAPSLCSTASGGSGACSSGARSECSSPPLAPSAPPTAAGGVHAGTKDLPTRAGGALAAAAGTAPAPAPGAEQLAEAAGSGSRDASARCLVGTAAPSWRSAPDGWATGVAVAPASPPAWWVDHVQAVRSRRMLSAGAQPWTPPSWHANVVAADAWWSRTPWAWPTPVPVQWPSGGPSASPMQRSVAVAAAQSAARRVIQARQAAAAAERPQATPPPAAAAPAERREPAAGVEGGPGSNRTGSGPPSAAALHEAPAPPREIARPVLQVECTPPPAGQRASDDELRLMARKTILAGGFKEIDILSVELSAGRKVCLVEVSLTA